MNDYPLPSSKAPSFYEISGFKGVDFTSSQLEVIAQRSPNAKNIINNDGYIESRNGYDILNTIGSQINGVWNVDVNGIDTFLVHSGTCLYQCSADFSESALIFNGMSNNRSKGLYFNDYLFIFDGVRAVVFSKFDGTNYEAKFLDSIGYVPTTVVSIDINGAGTNYEARNLMSPYFINTFVPGQIEGEPDSEGSPTYIDQSTFKLNETDLDEITLVEKLTSAGTYEEVQEYTCSLPKGEVYFTPGVSPVTGHDSVRITAKKDYNVKSKINNCDIAYLYGYEGNTNRIFVSGNSDLLNYDYWCHQDNPLYWPDENFAKIGIEPIIGYEKLTDGNLAILKKHSDTDNTIYYRNYNLLNEVEVFPIKNGVKNIGCVSKYAINNLLNDPLFLSEQGVFSIIGSDNGEKFAQQRSYYVNGKLLKEPNLENAISISVDGKYYIGINNHVYIADSRYLSYPKHAKTEQYQYEWFYWENIPARVFFSWNNKLYFGTDDGKICKFGDTYKDNNTNISVLWETPFIDFNVNEFAKTIKNVLLILNPKTSSSLTFSYELDDGTVEIIAKQYSNLTDDFPKTIYEKEKISKFMFIKFIISNETDSRMSFERLGCEWKLSGKYKGE